MIGKPSGSPNHIENYRAGIRATNSNFEIYNTIFSDIAQGTMNIDGTNASYNANIFGLGMDELDTPFITDAAGGITSTNYNLSVTNAKFTNIGSNGIYIKNNTIPSSLNVSESRFETYVQTGIYMAQSMLSNGKIIECILRDNIPEPADRSGIRMDVCKLASTGQFLIQGNTFFDDYKVHPDPSPSHNTVGIWLLQTQGIEVDGNTFYQNYETTAEHSYKGILLFNTSKDRIVGNDFFTNYGPAPSINFYKYRGIDNTRSSECLISCNYSENHNQGFYFLGSDCNRTIFRLNEMQDNRVDLFLEPGTIIGEQPPPFPDTDYDEENKWPSESTTEAEYAGDPDPTYLLMSRFFVPTDNQNSPLWADPRIPDVSWFILSDNEPSLSLLCFKEIDSEDPPFSKASRLTIEEEFEPYKGYPATIWDAQLVAFSELSAYPSLKAEESLEEAFYDEHKEGKIGTLQNSRDSWENIGRFSELFEEDWNDNQELISQKLDDLRAQIDLMEEAETENDRDEIADNILALNEDLEDIFEAQEDLVDTYLTEVSVVGTQILYDLDNLEPTEVWEENLQIVLTLLVERLLANAEAWTNTQYEDLETIADQCRYEGGVGVGLARAAIGKLEYDDEADCPGYSLPRASVGKYTLESKIIPNPANLKCEIKLSSSLNGLLTVSDVQGKIQQQFEIKDKNKFEIDTQNLAPGVYFVRINSDQTKCWMGKFAVLH